jgi:hypothetical protein
MDHTERLFRAKVLKNHFSFFDFEFIYDAVDLLNKVKGVKVV